MPGRKHSTAARRRPGSGGAAAEAVWFYGLHPVRAALANPRRRCYRLVTTAEGRAALGAAFGPAAEILPRRALEALLPPGAVHQGAAVLAAPLVSPSLAAACAPRDGARDLVVALDQLSDPRNVGAILRAAAAFEARAVVLTERHAPPESGALAKAASGALETVALVRVVNLARALEELKALGYWVVGLAAEAEARLDEIAPVPAMVLVLGAEGAGLRRLVGARCDHLARLPTGVGMPSLNVAAAAAIALYELADRPRRPPD